VETWQQTMDAKLLKVILDEQQINHRVVELGQQVTAHYLQQQAEEIVVIGILRGSVLFLSDLIRHLKMPVTIDFMAISSYTKGTESSGMVRILKDINESIEGKHVLIVEDIVDTGLTLNNLQNMLWARKPKSLAVCTLLNKPSRREVEVEVDFCGFEIPNEFVIGYGLDFNGHYRHLPYVGVLKPEVYQTSK
jgi:hypoxanthine phosphoribosyltransferase